jgi:hypothetical protein
LVRPRRFHEHFAVLTDEAGRVAACADDRTIVNVNCFDVATMLSSLTPVEA